MTKHDYATIEDKYAVFLRPRPDGHTDWTGERARPNGNPIVRLRGTLVTAARLAFAAHYGRPAHSNITVACGHRHCLTGAHLDDGITRYDHRTAYKAIGL